jgi:hypothetical protein
VEPSARKLSNHNGVDEIGQQDIIDLLTEAVGFAGVTNFVGVEDSGRVAVRHEDAEYGGGMMDSMREAHGRVVQQAMAR